MDDLSEQLIDHMDTFGERTIQGAFCSVCNWGVQAIQRDQSRAADVIVCSWKWWLAHAPESEPGRTAWVGLQNSIDLILKLAVSNGGETCGS